jgi:hypothetical protein
MKQKDWLPQVFLFATLVSFFYTRMQWDDFVSECTIVLTAIMYGTLAHDFMPGKKDKLRWYIILTFGSIAFRCFLFALMNYLTIKKIWYIPENTIRVITFTPMWIMAVILHVYIKKPI